MEEECKKLQEGIEKMSNELEVKGKEVLNIRSQANQTLR